MSEKQNSELFYSVMKDLCEMNELATCSICTRIFEEPVLLRCGHTFCSGCIRENENQNSKNHLCPLCRKPISRREKYGDENVIAALSGFMRSVSNNMKDSAKKDDYQFLNFMKRYKPPSPCKDLSSKIPVSVKPKNVLKPKNIPSNPKSGKAVLTSNSNKHSLRSVPKTQVDKPKDAFDVLLESSKKQPRKTYRNKKKQSKPKVEDENDPAEKILEFQDDKSKQSIVKWLMDSQNEFNRRTQTQEGPITESCLLGDELVSISQVGSERKKSKSKKKKTAPEMRKCRSLEILVKSSKPRRKRRSISHLEEGYVEQSEEGSFCNDIIQMMEDDYLENLENEFMEPNKKVKLNEASPSNELSRIRKQTEEGFIPHTASTAWDRMESLNKSLQAKEKKLNIVQTENTRKKLKPDLELKRTTVNLSAMESFFNNHMNNFLSNEDAVCEELNKSATKTATETDKPSSSKKKTYESPNYSGNEKTSCKATKRTTSRTTARKLQYNKENSNTSKSKKKSNTTINNTENKATKIKESPNPKIKILAINTISNAVNIHPATDQQNNELSSEKDNSKVEALELNNLNEIEFSKSHNEPSIAPNKQNNSAVEENNDSIKLNDAEVVQNNSILNQIKPKNESLSSSVSDDDIFKLATQKAVINKSDMSVDENSKSKVSFNTSGEHITYICENIKSNIQMLHTYFLNNTLDVQRQREILMDCLLEMKTITNSTHDKNIQAENITVNDDKSIQTEAFQSQTFKDNSTKYHNKSMQAEILTVKDNKSIQTEAFQTQTFKDNPTKYHNRSMQAEILTFKDDKSIQTENSQTFKDNSRNYHNKSMQAEAIDKSIQTDNEGFYISLTEAFKSQTFKENSMQTDEYVCEKCNDKPTQQKQDNYVFTGSFDNLEFETQNFIEPAAKQIKAKELSVLNINNSEHTVTQILRNLETIQSNTQVSSVDKFQPLTLQKMDSFDKQLPRSNVNETVNQSKVQTQKSQIDEVTKQSQPNTSKKADIINSFNDNLAENLNQSNKSVNISSMNKTVLEQLPKLDNEQNTEIFNNSKDFDRKPSPDLLNDEEPIINEIQQNLSQKTDAALMLNVNENFSQSHKSFSVNSLRNSQESPHRFSSQNKSTQGSSSAGKVQPRRRLSYKETNKKKRGRVTSPVDSGDALGSYKIRKVDDLMFRSDVSVCFDTDTQRHKPDTQAQGDTLDEVGSLGSSGFNMGYVDQIWDKIEKGLLGASQKSQKKEVDKTSRASQIKKSTTQEILEKCDQLINDVRNISSVSVRKPISRDTKSMDKKSSENMEALIDNDLLQDLEIPFEIELKPKRQENFSESMFGNSTIVNTCKLQKKNMETIISDFDDNDIDRDMELIKISDKKSDVVVNKLSLKHKNKDDSEEELFLSEDDDVIEGTPEKVSYRSVLTQNQFGLEPNVLECIKGEDVLPPPPEFQDMDVESELYVTPLNETLVPNQQTDSYLAKSVLQEQLPLKSNYSETETLISLSPIAKELSNKIIQLRPLDSSFKKSCSTPKAQKQVSIKKFMTKKKMGDGTELFANVTLQATERKICIACSRLNKNQIIAISALTNKKLATYSGVFNSNVTHMIVSTNDNNCVKDHTMKFVCAVASGIWVLNFKWVQECLANNAIVPEAPYEVLDVSGVPGPRESRLYVKQKPLLKGFKIHTAPSLTIPKEDIENVVVLLGGKIVSTPNELLERDGCICLIITETRSTQDFEQFENWLETLKVITVDIEWLSRSVGQYKLMSLRRFALCSDDSICELGYPSNLIENVPMSFSQSVML